MTLIEALIPMALPNDFREFIYPKTARVIDGGDPAELPDWVGAASYHSSFYVFGYQEAVRAAGFSKAKDLMGNWKDESQQQAAARHIPAQWKKDIPDRFENPLYPKNNFWGGFAYNQVRRSVKCQHQSLPSALKSIALLDQAASANGKQINFTTGRSLIIIRPAIFYAEKRVISPAKLDSSESYKLCLIEKYSRPGKTTGTLHNLANNARASHRTLHLFLTHVADDPTATIYTSHQGLGTMTSEIFLGRGAVVHSCEM
jgi:hypothetical protein